MKKTLVFILCALAFADFAYAQNLYVRNESDKKILVIKENGTRKTIQPNTFIHMDLRVGEHVQNWIGNDKMCEWLIPPNNVHYDVVGISYAFDGSQLGCNVDMRAKDQ